MGFEPTTTGLEVRCAVQLRYEGWLMMGIIADFWGVFSQRNINKASKAGMKSGLGGVNPVRSLKNPTKTDNFSNFQGFVTLERIHTREYIQCHMDAYQNEINYA